MTTPAISQAAKTHTTIDPDPVILALANPRLVALALPGVARAGLAIGGWRPDEATRRPPRAEIRTGRSGDD
jgi:hypothetical protein